jgi:hypothetical protein
MTMITPVQLGLSTVLGVAIISLIVGVLLGVTGNILAWVPLIAGAVVTVATAIKRAI